MLKLIIFTMLVLCAIGFIVSLFFAISGLLVSVGLMLVTSDIVAFIVVAGFVALCVRAFVTAPEHDE